MADEKTIILDLKFDVSDFTSSAAKLNKNQKILIDNQKQLKKEGREGSIEYQKNSEALKSNRKELSETNKAIQNVTIANKANTGSNEQRKAQLSILTLEYNKLGKEEREAGKRGLELKDQINSVTGELKDNEEGIGNNRRSVGDYGKALEGTKFGGFINGIKATGAALLANPIGVIVLAIVGALKLLQEAFVSSEEGQNKFAKAQAVLGSVLDNFVDVIATISETLVAMFENPQQALEDFGNLIKDNIVNRFEGLVELIPELGKAITLLFEGEFAEAGAVATNAVAKVSLGVEDLTGKLSSAGEALSEFSKEAVKDAEAAAVVADKRAKADLIERDLLVERAKLETRIADLRLRAKQEDSVSAADRRKALLEARDLEDGLLLKEQEVLKLRFEAQKQENTFARSNKENLDKEAAAEAALFQNQSARANAARTIQRELNTVNAQVRTAESKQAKEKEKEAKEAAKIAIELADLELSIFIKNNQSKLEANQFLTDELLKQEQERIELIRAEQEKATNEKFANQLISEAEHNKSINALNLENEEALLELQAVKDEADAEKELVDLANQREVDILNRENQFDILKQDLERSRIAELEAAKKSGADVNIINEKFNKLGTQLNADKFDAQLADAQEVFNAIGGLLAGNAQAEKAFAIASATINASQAITAVLAAKSTIPEPAGSIAKAVAAAAIGVKAGLQVRSIAKTPIPKAAKGGIFGGNLHSAGGTKGYFSDGTEIEVERGEIFAVINRNSSEMINRLSGINEAGGGDSFFRNGGTKTFMADGGIGIGSVSTSVEAESTNLSDMIEVISNQPNPVVSVQDINSVQSDTKIVEARADV